MCAGAIIQARLRRVIFGAYDPKSGMAGSVANVFDLPANHRVEVIGGVLQERCGDVLRDFFAKRRKDKSSDVTDYTSICAGQCDRIVIVYMYDT